MKLASLLLVASLFLVGLASAGVPQDIAALQAQVNVLIIKSNVQEAQTKYTLLFDHFIAVCGATNNVTNPACPAALDAVMSGAFCDAASFQGWNDFYAGFVIPTQSTPAAVKAFYVPLPAGMGGLSNHQIFPGVITVSADLSSATFKGKLTHAGITGNQLNFDYGTYTNTFKVNPVDLSVCMSSFSLMTSHVIGAAPIIVQIPAQTITVAPGTTSVTIPAQTITVAPSSNILAEDTSRI